LILYLGKEPRLLTNGIPTELGSSKSTKFIQTLSYSPNHQKSLLFKPDGNCIWDGSEQFEANGHEQKDEHNYLCSKISENP
jgi:hypothetical protein